MTQALSLRLKTETADLHRYAETRPLQRRLIRAQLPRETFARYLGQLLLVHRLLEEHLEVAARSDAWLAGLFDDPRRRTGDLLSDLSFYDVDPAVLEPLPATAEVLAAIEGFAENAAVLGGCLYVLEGSTNGNCFIARVLGKAWGLQGSEGTRALDPYGSEQREMWDRFKQNLDAPWGASSAGDVLAGAELMFRGIAAISDAVLALEAEPAITATV